ncbi:MAG: DUF1738 domain-containing protein [Deltaproteobacteria bacterium]|nr:DUF1738 domain-containing protein [Deltaproteobacteria bacterium]
MSHKTESLDRKRAAMTKAFIDAIETSGKWLPDYISTSPRNFLTGRPYNGINRLMLPVRQMINGWAHPIFAGIGQIKAAGGRVKAEEWTNATWVFFWGRTEKKVTVDGEEEKRVYWFPKVFKVWNLDQTEGIKESKVKGLPGTADGAESHDALDALLHGYMDAEGITFAHMDGCPHYVPSMDSIGLPAPEQYQSTEGYYRSLAHECVHSTGAPSRLDREILNMMGDAKYSREELVAQLGAAFTGAEYGLTNADVEARDAAYLASWVSVLKADPNVLFDAASDAEKALKFMTTKAGVESPEPVTV